MATLLGALKRASGALDSQYRADRHCVATVNCDKTSVKRRLESQNKCQTLAGGAAPAPKWW